MSKQSPSQSFPTTTMGWQTTFTLSKRSKGCYLVTDEVMRHIGPGLKGVQVNSSTIVL